MKPVGIVFGGLVAVVLFFVILYYGGIIGNRVQANYQKRVVTSKVQQHVRTAQFAQPAYEHFFNLCASVQTAERTIDSQEKVLKSTHTNDRARILDNISANEIARADAINQYNADAGEYTRGQFLASNLPARLQSEPYTKGNYTQCAT